MSKKINTKPKVIDEPLPEPEEAGTEDATDEDDNREIMQLLAGRLNLGRERYGHGVRVDNDTKSFGTKDNDWELMALEELLDGLVYTTAAIIRHLRYKKRVAKSGGIEGELMRLREENGLLKQEVEALQERYLANDADEVEERERRAEEDSE